MNEWRQSTWGDEISLAYGKGIRGYTEKKGPYRVFGSNGPVGWTTEALVPGPGVILGRKGAYRGVRFSSDPFFVIDTAYYVVPKSNNNIQWLYYAIIHYKLGEIDDGSPVPSTTRAAVYVCDLAVPPPSEQAGIAAVLGALDDKIELNQQMNETLEAMARAIFKDWFVDFGPTRAKAEGRTSYLAPDFWGIFPDILDNERPIEWNIAKLSDVAEVIMGASPNGDTYNSDGIGVPLVNGPVEFGEFFLKETKWTSAPTRMSKKGDLIVCVRGSTTGRHAYADGEYCLGRGVCAIRARRALNGFVEHQVLDRMAELLTKTTGSVFPNLAADDIKSFPVLLPPAVILQRFETLVEPLRARVRANVRENATLAQTRDLLLPKLISGEIRVRDAEALAADVL